MDTIDIEIRLCLKPKYSIQAFRRQENDTFTNDMKKFFSFIRNQYSLFLIINLKTFNSNYSCFFIQLSNIFISGIFI